MSDAPAVELLSPAGDMACLNYALAYGADAVYLGSRAFGLRSSCANFTDEELREATKKAHMRQKKVYLTLNTLPHGGELAALPALIECAAHAGVDAFIVADLGVLALCRRFAPDVAIHFSTQAGIVNHEAARMAHSLGAARVILARELTLGEIADIRAKTPAGLALEVFVHGAMCVSVSGRCLLSQYLTGRDANRGRCAQSCRWKYSLHEEQRPGLSFEIGEGEGGSYILNADDLCTAPFLDQILAAGATSLKIEGRGKSFYYVASTTAAYRAALDAALSPGPYRCPDFAREELTRTSHRPYSPGFYLSKDGATQSPDYDGYIREWQPVGVVLHSEGGRLHCEQRGKFTLGQTLELLVPGGKAISFTPADIRGENGEALADTRHTHMRFSIPAPPGVEVPEMSIVRGAL